MKKIFLFLLVIQLSSCAELQQVVDSMPSPTISNAQIAGGLKEALQKGITNQVSLLSVKDGFYKNQFENINAKRITKSRKYIAYFRFR